MLNAPALDILAKLPRVGGYVIAGQAAGTPDDKPRADLNRPCRAVLKRAGLTGLRIHDLSHTHASVGAGLGLGLPIIGKLLGHTQSSTTARYAHLDNDPLFHLVNYRFHRPLWHLQAERGHQIARGVPLMRKMRQRAGCAGGDFFERVS